MHTHTHTHTYIYIYSFHICTIITGFITTTLMTILILTYEFYHVLSWHVCYGTHLLSCIVDSFCILKSCPINTCGDTHMSFHLLFHLTALLPLSIHQSTLWPSQPKQPFSHPSFTVYYHKQRKRPPASVLHPTGHSYHLCQTANGRADWTAGDRNIRTPFGPTRWIVPVPDLTHLEATAIQVILAGKPAFILAVYLTPSRPLIVADLTACIGGGLPVLMAGDLIA